MGLTLDKIGIRNDTDKCSYHHDYLNRYEKYFECLRNEKISLLEIGIYRGSSLKMWEDYFVNGDIYGLDIIDYGYKGRSHLYFGRQDDKALLTKIIKDCPDFDIIIDDGSHRHQDQITSFKFLFPHIKSGGFYVIEDIHTSYPPMGYGINPGFIYSLIDNVYEELPIGYGKQSEQSLNIHITKSLLIIEKNK